MANTFDPNVSPSTKALAQKVIDQLELDGFFIQYDEATKKLFFKHGFHVATVLTALVEGSRWADVRHVFRSVFKEGPQLYNYGSSTEISDWSRGWRE